MPTTSVFNPNTGVLDSFYDPAAGDSPTGTHGRAEEMTNANDAIAAVQSYLATIWSTVYGQTFYLKKYGGKADGVIAYDGAASGTTVTSASFTPFTGTRTVILDRAGVSGNPLVTTFTCTAAGTGTLGSAAPNNVTAAQVVWGTDDTAAWNSMLTDWYAKGGGNMTFTGVSIVTGQIIVPNDNTTSTPTNGAGPPDANPTVGPWQPPGAITGVGGKFDGQWGGNLTGPDGSILVVATTTGPAAVVTEGTGILELSRFTSLQMTPDSVAFLQNTNTTVIAHYGGSVGRSSKLIDGARSDTATTTSGSATVADTSITANDVGKQVSGPGIPAGSFVYNVVPGTSFQLVSGGRGGTTLVNATASATVTITVGTVNTSACSQTVFSFGGTTTATGLGTNAPFQGYGTALTDWYFDRIRHAAVTGDYANGIFFHRLTVSETCGSPVSGDAPLYFNTATGNVSLSITDFVASMRGYANGYAVYLANQSYCLLTNVLPVDGNTTPYAAYFGPGSTNNLIVAGYRQNPAVSPFLEDTSVRGKNRFISSGASDSGTVVLTSTAANIGGGANATAYTINLTPQSPASTYDPGGLANGTGFTVKISGTYLITGQVAFGNGNPPTTGPSSGQVRSALIINGNTGGPTGGMVVVAAAGGTLTTAAFSFVVPLNAGDTVALGGAQFSGSGPFYIFGPNSFLTATRQ